MYTSAISPMVIIEFLEFAHKNKIELAKHDMDEFRLYLIKNNMAHRGIGEFNLLLQICVNCAAKFKNQDYVSALKI